MRTANATGKEVHQVPCKRSGCGEVEVSTRTGTFLAHSKLPLRQQVLLLYFFAAQIRAKKAKEMAQVSEKTVSEWYAMCRDLCSQEMLRCDTKVGGVGHTVEIDETSLKKKSKYNRGRRHPDSRVFGGIDRQTKKCEYLKDMNYQHQWVNHKKHFKDPTKGAHTNTIG
ncbi:TPA: hypothetical protein N0F65_001723 [Lagenidium giganteum]|uniref:Transposase n=1 Tax=Lagenidium giganteum TaxID=4803 RepID=A0AAV2Z5K7_9STRA|nr:TPA: hypothetical protein N0F65_001723 [Lagenidium giganteum]